MRYKFPWYRSKRPKNNGRMRKHRARPPGMMRLSRFPGGPGNRNNWEPFELPNKAFYKGRLRPISLPGSTG